MLSKMSPCNPDLVMRFFFFWFCLRSNLSIPQESCRAGGCISKGTKMKILMYVRLKDKNSLVKGFNDN